MIVRNGADGWSKMRLSQPGPGQILSVQEAVSEEGEESQGTW